MSRTLTQQTHLSLFEAVYGESEEDIIRVDNSTWTDGQTYREVLSDGFKLFTCVVIVTCTLPP